MSTGTTKLHSGKDTAQSVSVQPGTIDCITSQHSKAWAHKDMALKPSCGQESLQKSKQLCCSLNMLPQQSGSRHACSLKPTSLQEMKGSALTAGKQHTWLRKDSTLPSLARLGAVAVAQKLAGTGDMLGLSQQQAGLLLWEHWRSAHSLTPRNQAALQDYGAVT